MELNIIIITYLTVPGILFPPSIILLSRLILYFDSKLAMVSLRIEISFIYFSALSDEPANESAASAAAMLKLNEAPATAKSLLSK